MRPPEIFPVGFGIWCVRRGRPAVCSYVVTTDPGAVLVDSGMLRSGADPMMALQEARVGLSSIRGLVLTHWHAEHAAGAAALKARSGCRVYYSEEEAPKMTGGADVGVGRRLADRLSESGALGALGAVIGPSQPQPIAADHHPVDGELLFDDAFRVIKTPGHTEGHVALYHSPSKALFTGDAVSVIDGELRFPSLAAACDRQVALESMKRMLDRDLRFILPGRRGPLVEDVELQRRLLLDRVSSPER